MRFVNFPAFVDGRQTLDGPWVNPTSVTWAEAVPDVPDRTRLHLVGGGTLLVLGDVGYVTLRLAHAASAEAAW